MRPPDVQLGKTRVTAHADRNTENPPVIACGGIRIAVQKDKALRLVARHPHSRIGDRTMRLPEMTTRRWMLVIAAVALILAVITQMIAPIVWDREGRARDAQWLKEKSGEHDKPP
jgi:hypothetical protein